MINFRQLQKNSKNIKWENIHKKQENNNNDYSCYWSKGSGCKYCHHEHCIFDVDWLKEEKNKEYEKIVSNKDYLKKYEMIVDEMRGY